MHILGHFLSCRYFQFLPKRTVKVMASAGRVRRPTTGAAWRGRLNPLLNASQRSITTLSSLTTDIPDTLTLKHCAGRFKGLIAFPFYLQLPPQILCQIQVQLLKLKDCRTAALLQECPGFASQPGSSCMKFAHCKNFKSQ